MEDTFRSVDGTLSVVGSDGNVAEVDEQDRLKCEIVIPSYPHTISGTEHTGQLSDDQIPDDITRDSELTTTSGDIVSQIPLDHSDLNDDEPTKHRLINDSSSSSTELLSSQEVDSRITSASGSLQDQIDASDEHNEKLSIQGGSPGEYYHLDGTTYSDLVSGDDVVEFYETSYGQSTTNSTSFQTKVDLDFTVSETGYYKVIHGFLWSMGSTGVAHASRINYENGTYFGGKFQELKGASYNDGQYVEEMGFYIINMTAGSRNIKLQYRTEDGGTTAYIKEAALVVQRVLV